MPELKNRLSQNVAGAFYVDSTCIDCGLCPDTAPDFFKRDDDAGVSFVYRQPVTAEQIEAAQEAMDGCPTESIGNDGEKEARGEVPNEIGAPASGINIRLSEES
jgi:ferredoxin